ncbi:ABC transporter ATP-binding protein [Herbiconiux sp. UC225_62]|uniref:ABC transporter ATP-binding protein n=1 Tax=Herbiconiux sp. UC225_62 TaxID=3350168 RepID=UPI0036D2BD14
MKTSALIDDGPGAPARPSNTPYSYSVREVSKIFSGRNGQVDALRDVSFDFDEGSFTCIVGPSGCGKSTLLRILGGLETATYGSVDIRLPESRVPQSAFVFQEHGVFPWFDVIENVAFGQRMAGVGKREREETASRWISEVGLSGFEHAYPHQLSGGMRQRIAIARAFATGSPALLMDEPLGALDAQTRMLMQEQLVRLWEVERKTVVLVTHSIEEALLLGDRIIVMSARPGRIKEVIDVPFGRPRDVSIEGTVQFAEMRQSIWESLRDEVRASMRFS